MKTLILLGLLALVSGAPQDGRYRNDGRYGNTRYNQNNNRYNNNNNNNDGRYRDNSGAYDGKYQHDYVGHYEHDPSHGRYYHDYTGHYVHDDSGAYKHDGSGNYNLDNGKYVHNDNPYVHTPDAHNPYVHTPDAHNPYVHKPDAQIPYKGDRDSFKGDKYKGDNDRYKNTGSGGKKPSGAIKPPVAPIKKPVPVTPTKPVTVQPTRPAKKPATNPKTPARVPGSPNLIGENTFQEPSSVLFVKPKPVAPIVPAGQGSNVGGKVVEPPRKRPNIEFPSGPRDIEVNGYHWEFFDGDEIQSSDVAKYTPDPSEIRAIDDKGFFKLTAPHQVKYAIVYDVE